MKDLEKLFKEIKTQYIAKQSIYGEVDQKIQKSLEQFYPNGIKPETYEEFTIVVKLLEKISRLTNENISNDSKQDAYADLVGYSLLGYVKNKQETISSEKDTNLNDSKTDGGIFIPCLSQEQLRDYGASDYIPKQEPWLEEKYKSEAATETIKETETNIKQLDDLYQKTCFEIYKLLVEKKYPIKHDVIQDLVLVFKCTIESLKENEAFWIQKYHDNYLSLINKEIKFFGLQKEDLNLKIKEAMQETIDDAEKKRKKALEDRVNDPAVWARYIKEQKNAYNGMTKEEFQEKMKSIFEEQKILMEAKKKFESTFKTEN